MLNVVLEQLLNDAPGLMLRFVCRHSRKLLLGACPSGSILVFVHNKRFQGYFAEVSSCCGV